MSGRFKDVKAPVRGRRTVVWHVGDLSHERVASGFSQEGGELSVSRHPREWADIAHLGGDLWKISRSGAKFLQVRGHRHAVATAWAVKHGYLQSSVMWNVGNGYDEEVEDEVFLIFDSREKAEKEAEAIREEWEGDEEYVDRLLKDYMIEFEPGEIEEVEGYRFGPRGEDYWYESFPETPIEHTNAEAFAPIFYARAKGYDGVWFNETYNPSALSCPRGLILQEKIPEWTVERASWKEAPEREDE